MLRRASMVVLMVSGLGIIAWAGIYNYRERQAAMEHMRATHQTLVKAPDGGTDVSSELPADEMGRDLRGKSAPVFKLKTLDGKPFSSAELKGHPAVINFWATYCGPCKLEMPWFEEFSHKYQAQGLRVIGIDDEEGVTNKQIALAAQRTGVTYPILIADSSVEKAFGLGDYLPSTYYIDAAGNVVAQTPGAPSKDEVEANILKALGK